MLNFRKRIFLFLTILMTALCVIGCQETSNSVRIKFDANEYEVRLQSKLEVKPVISASSDVDKSSIEVVYESSDEDVVRYEHGVLYPVKEGEAQIKIYWKDHDVVFDKATVKVIKPALPELKFEENYKVFKNAVIQLPYSLYLNYTDATAEFTALTPEIATITADGVITALKVGKAQFNVVISDYEESKEYTVNVEVVESDFNITYVLDGGTNHAENLPGYNTLDCPIELYPATKEGYKFVCWLLDGAKTNEIPAGTSGDITLEAYWVLIDYEITYPETVDTEELPKSYNVEELPIALPTLEKENYVFKGWKLGEQTVTEIPVGTIGEITLSPVFEAVSFEIKYSGVDEATLATLPQSYTVDQLPLQLPELTKEGYAFKGWFNGTEYVKELSAETVGEVSLTPGFEIVTYEITYDLAGGKFNGYASLEEIAADFVNDYNTYAGSSITHVSQYWADAKKSSFWKDATYNAKWKWMIELLIKYSKAQGRSTDYLTQLIAETPVVSGYATQNVMMYLLGINNDIWNSTYKATCGGLSSKWTAVDCSSEEVQNSWKAVFSPVTSFTFETEVELKTPTREGYKFVGWFVGEQQVTKIEKGTTNNVTVVAKWEEDVVIVEHTITYDVDGGTLPEGAQTKFVEGTGLATLPTPTREGYKFLGWYEGETLVEAISAERTTDIALKASWEEIVVVVVEHTITYDVDGGTLPEGAESKFVEGTGLATLPTPTREGYKFLGWYEGETLVDAISAERTTDISLKASWEKIVEVQEFTITYDLDGGSWPKDLIESYEAMAAAFIKDYEAYIRSYSTPYKGEELTPADFMKISYGYGNLDDFFDSADYSQWAWIRTFVTEYCAKVNDTYATNIADKNGDYHNVILRGNVHGFINNGKYDSWPKSADYSTVTFDDFKDKVPAGKVVEGPVSYKSNEGATLVVPTKEGYDFAGWILNDQIVTEIAAGTTGNLELKARWRAASSEQGAILVGPNETYKTLDEAMAVAMPGDTIKVLAGTYKGGTISVNGVKVLGPNAGVNPVTDSRSEEAVFTSDITIAANNVTIDGIKLTGVGRLVGDAGGIEDLTITNVLISECALNTESGHSKNAPLYFFTNVAGAEFKNLVFTNILNKDTTESRGMILYGAQINGLTIKDSKFVGKRSNYNDGIKITSSSEDKDVAFGIKGNVEIVGNHFENYAQYVIWIRSYLEGNYSIQNNTFVNNGSTAGSHAAVSFITFGGSGSVKIDMLYNTVKASYMLLRIDSGLTNAEVYVNYNKLLECGATYYVKNANSSFKVDATNNWYDKAPTDNVFLNATYNPYYEDENKVPLYGQPLTFKEIIYQLNGGTLPEDAPKTFDSTTGLASLPTPTSTSLIFIGWKLNGEFVTSIAAGTDASVTLEAVWREDAIYVSKNGESYAVATIAEALAKAKAGDKIIILDGEWDESFTVSIANLTIAGANQGVNPNTDARSAETIMKGVISITSEGTNLTLDGLAFTGGAKIKNAAANTNVVGLTLRNSKAYDMENTTKWVLGRYASNAFLELSVSNANGSAKNITVSNNLFQNVGDINVLVNRVLNLSVDGNVFKNFGSDAIRVEGGYCGGYVYFTNNHFEQETAGHGNNAIFTYSIATSAATTYVVVKGNKFVKVGQTTSDTAPYNGVISSHFFQELETHWTISENIFDHCSNMMWIRNNGADENNWSCKVENNQFLGLPLEYYFGTYQGTDTESTNPHLAIFGANYYEDNDGNVITDLDAYKDKFKHLSTYGTAASTKDTFEEAESLEFWTIQYELNGGTCKGLVESYNSLSDTIKLPTPTWNIYHEFVRWTLNGETVTEIAKGTKGDLVIVAEWKELEGNPVTLEFELNGGNWMYESFNDISLDLLKDYNAWGGTNYTQENLPVGAWVNIDIHTFFYSDGMKEKWSWLATWLSVNGGTANKAGCAALVTYDDATSFTKKNGNFPYAVSYEFRAIMIGGAVTSNGNYKTNDYSDATLNETMFTEYLKTVVSTVETTEGKVLTLPTPKKPFLSFAGWYDNPEFTGEAVTTITVGATNPKYYAKFVDLHPVTNVNIKNAITTTKRFTDLQLEWEVLPADTSNKAVKFVSSDNSVATVDSKGYVQFLKAGTVTIKVVSLANDAVFGEMTVEVTVPTHIEGSFETNSYVVLGDTIKLLAELKNGEGTLVWSSLNEDIATVSAEGEVTPVKAGQATIVVSKADDATVRLEFIVIVYDQMPTEVLEFIARQNNANIFLRSQLGIGAGNYAYYADILSSVSKLLFDKYEIDKTYYVETPTKTNSGVRTGALEFITVHYTGNMAATSYASSNANFFVNQSTNSSIHYVTGENASHEYGIYACYDEAYVCWHAGDGTGTAFGWDATGVYVREGDPEVPVVTITENSKFAINGTETTIACPQGYSRKWDSETQSMVNDEWIIPRDNKYLTDLGPAVKVADGQYFLGTTWWCNDQVAEGRVCSHGGNLNSIGIESACNEGSDLWLTWQKTAQLVADIMNRYNLGIDRVKGHNFYSAKDCPQPMLENDDEIWYEFIDCVEAEYEAITTYEGWTFTMKSNSDLVSDMGRVISQPEYDTCVTYTVTATKGEETKTITLSSMIPGYYRNLAQGER